MTLELMFFPLQLSQGERSTSPVGDAKPCTHFGQVRRARPKLLACVSGHSGSQSRALQKPFPLPNTCTPTIKYIWVSLGTEGEKILPRLGFKITLV